MFGKPPETSPEPARRARIAFAAGKPPASPVFGDVYFSDEGGLAEAEHVFIGGCGLGPRLLARAGADPEPYVVGETGFGTGLNLLALMIFYEKLAAAASGKLPEIIFVSAEKYPVSPADALRAHALFPAAAARSRELAAALAAKPPRPGRNSYRLGGRFRLELLVGDAAACFARLGTPRPADSWFLDGFDPKKNPEMWSPGLMKILYDLSAEGATLATFTVCQAARANIARAGFRIAKRPGFGRKREMLAGFKPPAGPEAPPARA